jgi:hypothetical protein
MSRGNIRFSVADQRDQRDAFFALMTTAVGGPAGGGAERENGVGCGHVHFIGQHDACLA